MNLIKIAKQIFDQQLKTKRQRAEQFIEKNLLQDEITTQDVYEIAAFAIQQLNNEDDLIINLTEKQLPKKIINIINKIKQFTNDHLQHVIVYTNNVNAWIFPKRDLGDLTVGLIQMISTHMDASKIKIKQQKG